MNLQAINALTFLGDQAKAVLAPLKRQRPASKSTCGTPAAISKPVLEGRYDPSYQVFPGFGRDNP